MQKSSTLINRVAEKVVLSKSAEETQRIGENFAGKLRPGNVVAFFGDLGSGKTTFIKGLCRGLRVVDEVSSPSFTLINEYAGAIPVYHFDFYRIASPDIWELGCDEYFYGDGICLIEWADRILDFLPENRIEIRLQNLFAHGNSGQREIRISQV